MPEQAVAKMLSILDLEQIEVNLFRGQSPQDGWQRVFGGQVIGQALVAATRTVEDNRIPHSLHAYFLLGGDPKVPIIYEVERIRDGKSFSTRRVMAIQHGQPIFSLSASFQTEEIGFDHQTQMPDVPAPESLMDEEQAKAFVLPMMPPAIRAYFERPRPIAVRPVSFKRYMGEKDAEGRSFIWIKASAPLPDQPHIHRAVLAYASDLTLLDAALIPHGRSVIEKDIQAASLDHAMWFHRPFRADDWLLYAQHSPSAQNGRGLSRGSVFTRDGLLVASVMQEGVVRQKRAD